ncbi:MAG TPA: peptidase M23, partial [Methylophaga sp.]|nr:peptidase M23 [Methylophaga sp.]
SLGRSGTQVEQLHFEIRRNGKPVDPIRFLPKQ